MPGGYFQKPCPKCGGLYRGRCEKCKGGTPTPDSPQRRAKKQYLYGGDYRRRAKLIRENATHCYICKKSFDGGEVQADHLFPELGHRSPLAPTHPECNRRKGNRPADL